MPSPLRPTDRKDVLDALAFQSELLALSTALETRTSDESTPDLAVVTTELRRLAQAAREAAQALHSAPPSASPE